MQALQHPQHLRRTTWWVLAAWLCVLVASIWAPAAGAQQSQRYAVQLCSGMQAPADAPNPLADVQPDPALHHVLECPLCLPLLTPPPQPVHAACVPASMVQPQAWRPATHAPARVALPPVRAPPLQTWTLS